MMSKKHVKNKMEVISGSGHKFKIDITDEAISRFSRCFRHGDRFKTGTIMGVAREYEWNDMGEKGLWVMYDSHEGRVCFVYDPSELDHLKETP